MPTPQLNPTTKKSTAKTATAKKPTATTTTTARRATQPPPARLTLAAAMQELAAAGSEQTRKTYRRHGASEPLFGVSFATLKTMVKRIGVDHELALGLWDTGNHDARTLAVKIADPAQISSADLDRWAAASRIRSCGGYVAMLAVESPHAATKAREWLAAAELPLRCAGWSLLGQMAMVDEDTPDALFAERVAQIERTIHAAPNDERDAMNAALIAIGCRSPALRKAAAAAAKKIGKVEVDHGDTACKTPDAGESIDKAWAHAKAKEFASPAAQERARESMRTRC